MYTLLLNVYTEDRFQTLTYRERSRVKPSMYVSEQQRCLQKWRHKECVFKSDVTKNVIFWFPKFGKQDVFHTPTQLLVREDFTEIGII